MSPLFFARELKSGAIYERSGQAYPSSLVGHCGDATSLSDPNSHNFGIVLDGNGTLEVKQGNFPLQAGMYFSVPGALRLLGNAKIALFSRHGYNGLFSVGGPTEEAGRLCYIDHCRTTLLCPPPRNGDPCLNLLSFPPHIKQSAHIHPTLRLGAVFSGEGECVMGSERHALRPGLVFAIEPGARHCFESGPAGMNVIAYHPDSDGGPTDQFHPMLNRTYLK